MSIKISSTIKTVIIATLFRIQGRTLFAPVLGCLVSLQGRVQGRSRGVTACARVSGAFRGFLFAFGGSPLNFFRANRCILWHELTPLKLDRKHAAGVLLEITPGFSDALPESLFLGRTYSGTAAGAWLLTIAQVCDLTPGRTSPGASARRFSPARCGSRSARSPAGNRSC
jgi:hypothetical protein